MRKRGRDKTKPKKLRRNNKNRTISSNSITNSVPLIVLLLVKKHSSYLLARSTLLLSRFIRNQDQNNWSQCICFSTPNTTEL